jgi:hypothetical protein
MKSQPFAAVFALIVGAAWGSAGCVAYAHAGASADVEAPVTFAEPPTLVAVDGGVWVVQDSDYPVYYVDDSYWVFRDGTWYRSRSYEGGWVTVEVTAIPTVIVNRHHAEYVHYRGAAAAHTRPAPRRDEGERARAEDSHDRPHGHDELSDVHSRRETHEDAENERHETVPAKSDPPGMAHERKSDGAQPGPVGKGGPDTSTRKRTEKKDDKHK